MDKFDSISDYLTDLNKNCCLIDLSDKWIQFNLVKKGYDMTHGSLHIRSISDMLTGTT